MSDFSTRRAPGLDLVRCVAILFVMISHYWPLYERFPTLTPLKWIGHLGVELFFVLSGFLIGSILLRKAAEADTDRGQFAVADVQKFWVRRWFRTLPNYALFLGLFLLFEQPWVNGHWQAWALSVFFLQNLFGNFAQGTFEVAWSLCVEEWLYLLLPLVLVVLTSKTKNCVTAAFYAAAILIVVPTLLRCTTIGKTWDNGVRHVVIYRLDAIAWGVLLAALARYRRQFFDRLASGRWAFAGAAGIAVIWYFGATFGNRWMLNGEAAHGLKWFIMAVLFFSATSLAIVPIVAWASRLNALPWGLKTCVFRISLYSYSMYLAHLLVFYYANPILRAGAGWFCGEFCGFTFVMLALNFAAVFGFSAVIYRAWEAPMTCLRERYAQAWPDHKPAQC